MFLCQIEASILRDILEKNSRRSAASSRSKEMTEIPSGRPFIEKQSKTRYWLITFLCKNIYLIFLCLIEDSILRDILEKSSRRSAASSRSKEMTEIPSGRPFIEKQSKTSFSLIIFFCENIF